MEERKWCVYVHENKINGKKYVGITKQIPKYRWKKGGKGYSSTDNSYFYNAIQKYGWDNFNHEIIASNLTKEEADNFERTLIKELELTNRDKGYNIQNGGCISGVHSDEVKQKLSRMKKGVPTGLCGAKSAVSVEIDVYNLHGDLLETVESMSMASNKYGSNPANICACCKGKIKTSESHIFRYKGDSFDKFNTQRRTKGKSVAKVDLITGEIICTYKSLEEAACKSGVSNSLIFRYCNNEVAKKKLYDWKYIDTK